MAENKESKNIEKRKNEILGILLITLGAVSGIALFSSTGGVIGDTLTEYYKQLTGLGSYLMPFLFAVWGLTLIWLKGLKFNSKLAGFLLAYIMVLTIIHTYYYPRYPISFALQGKGGGIISGSISWGFARLFGHTGSYIVSTSLLLIGIILWFDLSLKRIFSGLKTYLIKLNNLFINKKEKVNEFVEEKVSFNEESEIDENEEEMIFIGNSFENFSETAVTEVEFGSAEEEEQIEKEQTTEENGEIENLSGDKTRKKKKYRLPGPSLLKRTGRKKLKVSTKSKLLEETLNSFGVKARVIDVNHGPTITRYEIQPASGVKVSKIVSLADDIALALAAPDVRIEAPIPGKAAVGIEVPHSANNLVRLGDIVSSSEYRNASGGIIVGLGKGIEGQPIIADLTRMPHLLVAGATGSGKSICINAIITSIIFKLTPEQVKLILIDPKKVELSNYKGLPHLYTPVVTDPKKAANVLNLVVKEMENRYELFTKTGTRGIDSYNKKVSQEEKLPYIVVIIDELSDLMMVAASEVEDNICRLAQMSRAAGIHLIIATQRPSVDVITGLIKANIPSRISFAVSSHTDSRTILDMGGAEKLLGNGDMLFAPVGMQKPQRIQGAYIENEEINKLVEFMKNQADPNYEVEPEDIKEIEISIDNEQDELYEEAVKLVVNYRASISMLQRRLHIGHSRAARLIDAMEEEGIVGPYAGSKPREVLISKDELEEYIGANTEKEEGSQ